MKVLLSIAGSDSGGGAGIQADIKTAEAFGVYSTTAITALTAQNTVGVKSIVELSANFVSDQLEAILEDFDIDVVKIGMLYSTQIIETVREILGDLSVPIVLDPVFISKREDTLLKDDAIESIRSLFPYVTLITPNRHEAKKLFGETLDINAPCPVLVKNSQTNPKSVDTLYYANNSKKEFISEMIESNNVHGTGCSFSTAIAANLALGHDLETSIQIAKNYIVEAIKNAPQLGRGTGPVMHKMELQKSQENEIDQKQD